MTEIQNIVNGIVAATAFFLVGVVGTKPFELERLLFGEMKE